VEGILQAAMVEIHQVLRGSRSDLLKAAQSSLDFWDNPFNDEDWNNA
jgi:hypothetical protein